MSSTAQSLAQTLRKACAANQLGVSGTSAQLLARLINAGKKAKSSGSAKSSPTSKPKKAIAKKPAAKKPAAKKPAAKQPAAKQPAAKPRAQFKATAKGSALRLSAAYYFYDVCDGKISRCLPQPIMQPDGRVKLKQIRMVTGPTGKKCPRWVLAQ